MKTAILTKQGFNIASVDTPQLSDDQVLVTVSHCGVCSGDLHLYQHKDAEVNRPLSLGHEVIGEVKAVGSAVVDLRPGDRVTAVDGVGGYSQEFLATENFLTKISNHIPEYIQMGEPIACCVHAVNRIRVRPDMRVAIVGSGFMGLVCQKMIEQLGCKEIVAFDLQDYRRDMALKMGADKAYDPRQYQIADADEGEFDIVVEAAGVANAMDFCGDLIAHHGQMLIVGYHQNNGGMRNINVQRWNYKAIDVFNGHVRRMEEKYEAMVQGLQMCADGRLDISPLLTSYALDDIEQAFKDLSDPNKTLFKAVIEVN